MSGSSLIDTGLFLLAVPVFFSILFLGIVSVFVMYDMALDWLVARRDHRCGDHAAVELALIADLERIWRAS